MKQYLKNGKANETVLKKTNCKANETIYKILQSTLNI